MLIARNQLAVTTSYGEGTTIRGESSSDISKLSIKVDGGDCIMQITEEDNGAFQNPTDTECFLNTGFHTLVPLVPWKAVRFKAVSSLNPPVVTVRAYGF